MKLLLVAVLGLVNLLRLTNGLTADLSASRAKFAQSFSSPAGKLTFSPELHIKEPTDPTSILLQNTAVQELSSRIRASKANAAFLRGSITALNTFCKEQESAMGSFPGPVPVVFCLENDYLKDTDLPTIAECGAHGVMIPVCSGAEIDNPAALESMPSEWLDICKSAMEYGVQPIPEVMLSASNAGEWNEDMFTTLLDKMKAHLGEDPVTLVVTVNPTQDDEDEVPLPSFSKTLTKRVPITGSLRAPAGDNRLSIASAEFKQAGFTSNLLRSECFPNFDTRIDLGIVGKFWAGCITDLKSTRSKSFSFRSKNNMEKSALTNWSNYQKSVMDSGALGAPEDSYSIVDSASGEYKGFA
eukprot:scaffold1987_cov145-Amphora_coffeaeformis.AAC.7